MKYYKFLTEANKGSYSNFDYTEYLPTKGKAGKWLPKIAELDLCHSGYHACKKSDILNWLNAQMFEVELEGIEDGGDKVVAHRMRFVKKIEKWNDRNARLAACGIAESVVKYWDKDYPNDNRPQEAIRVARLFANGKATRAQLDAARAAAWDAAWDAVWDAEGAAEGDAAWVAAWAAAWDAARAAARAAALKIVCKYAGI